MFFNELDLLEIRLNTLDEYVDYFVINESPTTFSGNNKPLYYLENRDRFKKFHHKIIYKTVEFTEGTFEHLHEKINWARQIFQRNSLVDALTECSDDDIIICSDIDEIFTLETLTEFYIPDELCHIEIDLYNYYINTRWDNYKWTYPTICNYGYLRGKTLDFIRHGRSVGKIISLKGWHFSSIGKKENIKYKYESVSDDVVKELLNKYDDVTQIIEYRKKEFENNFNSKLLPIQITINDFPAYIVNNQKKFKHLIKSI